ncbi:hypothetical protein HO133_004277 [Letharia lupina]|uniref:Uncharacterized protein n=1 Tax=Letharia lupina TaxID=560253 RepID=A0A8H6FK25_9LECA|nr:uncharacterized protein HO133_004277 [Letharia lupina]KAF6229940.1 hypothetical protein HO133_004277 [Letharia lupina]
MATGTAPKRLRFDLFIEHVDNTHSEPATRAANVLKAKKVEDYDKQTGQGEELGESCWHAGKMWTTSPGSLFRALSQDQNHPMFFRKSIAKTRISTAAAIPHLGKSSPIKVCRDYGCLKIQGKQWACISGLPAMGAMAI